MNMPRREILPDMILLDFRRELLHCWLLLFPTTCVALQHIWKQCGEMFKKPISIAVTKQQMTQADSIVALDIFFSLNTLYECTTLFKIEVISCWVIGTAAPEGVYVSPPCVVLLNVVGCAAGISDAGQGDTRGGSLSTLGRPGSSWPQRLWRSRRESRLIDWD